MPIHREYFANIEQKLTISQVLNLMPGHVYWKDTDGSYLGANHSFIQTVGAKSVGDIIGKKDAELLGHYADNVIENDLAVIHKKKELTIIEKAYDLINNPASYLSKKIPLYNEKKNIIGVLGLSIDITKKEDFKKGEAIIKDMDNHLQVNHSVSIILSKRQSECLYYTLRGMTAKEIAVIMKISVRTVEEYVHHIKIKFNCHSKAQLIGKAFELGYMAIKNLS